MSDGRLLTDGTAGQLILRSRMFGSAARRLCDHRPTLLVFSATTYVDNDSGVSLSQAHCVSGYENLKFRPISHCVAQLSVSVDLAMALDGVTTSTELGRPLLTPRSVSV